MGQIWLLINVADEFDVSESTADVIKPIDRNTQRLRPPAESFLSLPLSVTCDL